VQVNKLRLFCFRNLENQEIGFCPGTNLFFGRNGQGKTNLLESIFLLGYGRSFRTSSPRECIQHGQPECRMEARIEHNTGAKDLGITISQAEEKQLLLYRKPVGLGDFIGHFQVLAFTQEHLKVVRAGPGERRAFLDRALIHAYPGHMQRLAAYSRILKQRNRLLGDACASGVSADRASIESWDEKLIQEGSRILWNRMDYVAEMKKELAHPLCANEELEIHYASAAAGSQTDLRDLEGEFRQRLREASRADEKRGFTTVGPHRDDLKLLLNGKSLADYGSAGQQRSCLLALYFAQMEIHRKTRGFYPVFLMDDMEAELDMLRLQALLDHLAQRTQTFLTSAKEQWLPDFGPAAMRFQVQSGRIESAKP
jgi:DNA replication and repair protein RecF